MSYVYILNQGGHDYSDAERFGELVFCTQGLIDKTGIQHMYRELTVALEDSLPTDYIMLTSLSSLCTVAGSIFSLKHNRLNLLIFTRDGYVAREIFFPKDERD